MSVYKKLMAARIELHGMAIRKSGENTFAKYKYMELADFLIPTQQIFAKLDLCGVVSFTADIASLTITDMDDGSQIVITSPMGSAALKGCHEVQNIGAVETYQRRYLWVTALEIVEHDALDSGERGIDDGSERRQQWINDRKAEIAGAKSVGELKKIMDAALAKVRENNDHDAEDQLHEASLAKVSKAKPKPELSEMATA
jgi:hypothetical protein